MSELEAIMEALLLLDDTEVPEPIQIESEEDLLKYQKYLLWKWKTSLNL